MYRFSATGAMQLKNSYSYSYRRVHIYFFDVFFESNFVSASKAKPHLKLKANCAMPLVRLLMYLMYGPGETAEPRLLKAR